MSERLDEIEIDDIDEDAIDNSRFHVDDADPAQVELVASIKAQGLIEPVVVVERTQLVGARGSRKYALIVGRRRLHGHRTLGLPTIKAIVRVGAVTMGDALAANLAENVQRQDLRPCEQAAALLRLRAQMQRERALLPPPTRKGNRGGRIPPHGVTDAELGARVGMSQPWVNTILRIETKLCPELRPAWLSGRCSPTFLGNLVAHPPEEQRRRYAQWAGVEIPATDGTDPDQIDRDIAKSFGTNKGPPIAKPIRRQAVEHMALEVARLDRAEGLGPLTARDRQVMARTFDAVLGVGPKLFRIKPGPRTARSLVLEDDGDDADLPEPSP